MNNIKIITATEARNNWFEVLSWLNTNDKTITITKNNLPIAKISGIKKYRFKKTMEIAKSLRGFLKGKKIYFPYEDPKIIKREREYLRNTRSWKIK